MNLDYALGIVFYEMVTGRKPYQADTPMAVLIKHASEPLPRPSQYGRDLPEDVEHCLLKALAKKPEYRYQSMGEFATALRGLFGGREVVKKNRRPILPRDTSVSMEVAGDDSEMMMPKWALWNKQVRIGANAFYWIAGISLVGVFFGIYIGEAKDLTWFLIAILPSIGFAVLGYLARKRYPWSFITGMALYSLDAIGVARAERWSALTLHVFWAIQILTGLTGAHELDKLDRLEGKVDWKPKYPVLPKLGLVFNWLVLGYIFITFAFGPKISQIVAISQDNTPIPNATAAQYNTPIPIDTTAQENTPLPIITANASDMNVRLSDLVNETYILEEEYGEEYIDLSIKDANVREFNSDQIYILSEVFVSQTYWVRFNSSDSSTTAAITDFARNILSGDNLVFEPATNIYTRDSGVLQRFSDTTKGLDGFIIWFTSKNVLVRIFVVGTPSAVNTFDFQALAEIVTERIR